MYNERLREIREDRDLKQDTVAKAIGISQKQYSRYELGINELPIRYLIKLCKYYNMPSDYFLELGPYQRKDKR